VLTRDVTSNFLMILDFKEYFFYWFFQDQELSTRGLMRHLQGMNQPF
jgi:hypothetical protein